MLFCTVIPIIVHFAVRIFVLIKYCLIDNNIVVCLVYHIVWVCNTLILFCKSLMCIFTNYNTVIFLFVYYIVVLSIIMMFGCFVMFLRSMHVSSVYWLCYLWGGTRLEETDLGTSRSLTRLPFVPRNTVEWGLIRCILYYIHCASLSLWLLFIYIM